MHAVMAASIPAAEPALFTTETNGEHPPAVTDVPFQLHQTSRLKLSL